MLRWNGAKASAKPGPRSAGSSCSDQATNGRTSGDESTVTAPRTG